MSQTIFLKLGGSLITDKRGVEAIRPKVLARLAEEIQRARVAQPAMRLLLGHGSGSFGHVGATHYGTRHGVKTAEQWRGFAEVSASARRLNTLVVDALLAAGVPAFTLQPSASVVCEDGRILSMATEPLRMALEAGLVPVIFGDVALDRVRGGTIISTEEEMMFLADALRPSWLLLAGEIGGVLDLDGAIVPLVTAENLPQIAPALGGSHGADVTGGMASKVGHMLALVERHSQLSIRIFSGLPAGTVGQALLRPETAPGTLIR